MPTQALGHICGHISVRGLTRGVASAHTKAQHSVRESQYLSISKIFLYFVNTI